MDVLKETKKMLDEAGIDYYEDIRPGGRIKGNDIREALCEVLLKHLPKLKDAVRSYMSQDVVKEPDFKRALSIWRALDSVEDATEKLAQSEMAD